MPSHPLLALALSLLMLSGSPAKAAPDAALSTAGGQALADYASFMAREPLDPEAQQRLDQAWSDFQRQHPQEWQAYARQLVQLEERIDKAKTSFAIAALRDQQAADVHCPLPAANPVHDLQSVLDQVIEAAMPVIATVCGDDRKFVVTLADVRDYVEERRFFSEKTGLQRSIWFESTGDDGKPITIEGWAAALAKGFVNDWNVLGREDLSNAEMRWALTREVWEGCTDSQRTELLAAVQEAAGADQSLFRGVMLLHGGLIIGGTRVTLQRDLQTFNQSQAQALSALMAAQRAMQDLRSWSAP